MKKKIFKNKEYPNYKIMVKLAVYENCKDTSRMFDYIVDVYNHEMIGG